jgi:hypothetical protein
MVRLLVSCVTRDRHVASASRGVAAMGAADRVPREMSALAKTSPHVDRYMTKDTRKLHVLPRTGLEVLTRPPGVCLPTRLGKVSLDAWIDRITSAPAAVVAIDLLVVLWTVSWLVLGITVGTFVDRLGGIGESLEGTGQAIHRAGDAVGGLSDMPLVGEGFGSLADEIHTIGTETAEHGLAVEHDIHRLAVLIRVSRERERRALRRSLRSGDRVALA